MAAGCFCGITPACAGNSHRPCRNRSHRRDHPRLRGEQKIKQGAEARREGSPPLARGTAACRGYADMRYGITPACAGNSCHAQWESDRPRDHPRLRGEQATGNAQAAADEGSPPLARGTGIFMLRPCPIFRITPACAGNSLQ